MNGVAWICSECGERFLATLVINITEDTHTAHLDDSAIRKHLDMHEECYCHWIPVRALCSEVVIASEREPDPSCPIHKVDDWRARVLTQRLAAGLDVPIHLIDPEEKA